jgi:selenocysteine lyase/cysteine desulfurase
MTIEEARALFEAEGVYLNTASFGLPPRPAWDALQAALHDWRAGRTSWEGWNEATDAARASFARLGGVPVEWVAVGGTVSGLVGLVAAALPDGTRVISTDAEFTSLLWPFMAQGRGIEVTCVPASQLAEAIDARADVVAFSAVQSSNGEVADLDAVAASAAHHGALTLVDATHACGWMPFDGRRFDAFVCAAYKWLLSPRGTAFMGIRPALLERLTPQAAGWFAGDDPHASYYGPPLRLPATARRLDVSPAWFSWVGTAPALEVILDVGVEAIHEHDLRLANRFRGGLGLEPGDSTIVAAEVPGAEELLQGSGVMTATRAGMLRTSWHLYNTEEDVERVVELLSPVAARRSRP